ncbi:MAG: hypothetical protein WDZ37_00445 [Solirubrobacterales bacterium]
MRGDRDAEELAVIAVKTLGARPRPMLGQRRRSRQAGEPGGDPDPVAITRITVIAAEPFENEQAARSWLASTRSRDSANAYVTQGIELANRVVRAHRIAAWNPYEVEFSRERTYRIRIGFGPGDQLAEGLWSEARSVSGGSESRLRRSRIDPGSAVAEMLSGRRPAYVGDDLLLRARLDLDQGHVNQAAIQAHAAAAALAAEPRKGDQEGDLQPEPDRLTELQRLALRGELDAQSAQELEEIVSALERTARRRHHL